MLRLLLAAAAVSCTLSKRVSISNSLPRLATDGSVVDAHDGNVVFKDGRYFLYGEGFGPGNYVVSGNSLLPKLVVYSSVDMVHWEFGGWLHNNTEPGWSESGQWPNAPNGTWWCPWAVVDTTTNDVVLWFTASPGECCTASFGVARSSDGIHFELITLTGKPASGASVDGSSVLIDDDGTGYVAFTAINAPGQADHVVGIEKLSADLTASTHVQVGGYFPDHFVEGVMLFKREQRYYVIYGSCCCACREGSGAVVYSALNISGPWERQARDANCRVDAPVCAGMAPEAGLDRPTGQLTISAQGIGLSRIPLANNGTAYLWSGSRWLSGPNNPPQCDTLCTTNTGKCKQDPSYSRARDFDYWIPLQFGPDGLVQQFAPFVDSFELDLPSPLEQL